MKLHELISQALTELVYGRDPSDRLRLALQMADEAETPLVWTHEKAIDAEGRPCWLCEHNTNGVRRTAVTLGIIAGFYSSGGGSVRLEPVCEACARGRYVIPCMGISDPWGEDE